MSETPKNTNVAAWAAFGVVLAALVGAVWWMMPGERPEPVRTSARSTLELDPDGEGVKRRVYQLSAVAEEDDEPIPLEEDPAIPVVTDNCRTLIGFERRRVPQTTVLDALRDRSMRFTEDDLTCLTAGGVSPAVLDLAEKRVSHNAKRGIKGTPGRDRTREHETYLAHPSRRDER